ncbi:hypothetical protein ACFL1X_05310 [Candidatus Hydrogenedentota bacterium]
MNVNELKEKNTAMQEPDVQYTECYVAFLDILGFKELVERSEENAKVLEDLILALNRTADPANFERIELDGKTGKGAIWRLQVRAFSDSVVLFMPTESEMISWVFWAVLRLCDCMLQLGFCLRGAVTVGEMYLPQAWNKNTASNSRAELPIALGPGLIDAYLLESKEAIYPRIVISNKLLDHIKTLEKSGESYNRHFTPAHPICSSDRKNANVNVTDFIRTDIDGLKHIDIFHERILRQEYVRLDADEKAPERLELWERQRDDWLKEARDFIMTGIEEAECKPIYDKYKWFADYFNSCESLPPGFKITSVEQSRQFMVGFGKSKVQDLSLRFSFLDDDEPIIQIGQRARKRSWLTKKEFVEICRWKTRGRPQKHYTENSPEEIKKATRMALSSDSAADSIRALIELSGVREATASAILHFCAKHPYPIIDFRALWSLGIPEKKSYSRQFLEDYTRYCRDLAVKWKVDMRTLDRALWQYSKENQPSR